MSSLLFILIVALLAFRIHQKQRLMASRAETHATTPRWAWPCLLGLSALVPGVIFLAFLSPGPVLSFASWLMFTALCSLFGYRLQQALRLPMHWLGALAGGALGAEVMLAATLAWGYLRQEPFEDEGLGYVGSLVVWSPYVVLLGLGVGGAVCIGAWLVHQWNAGQKRGA